MIRHLLLAAALALGQGVAVAHVSEHHTLAAQHDCVVCAHAQHHDAGPAAAVASLCLSTGDTVAAAMPAVGVVVAPRHVYRSRGPPQSSLN